MTQLVPIELGEFCKVDSGFAFKSEQFSDDCNDVFLVKGSNLGHRQIKWDEGPWWNVDDYEKFERYQLREQDVLLAMDRPIVGGQLKYSWIKEGDPKALLVQRVARLRAIEPEDQKFLRYVIASPAFLQYIDTITTGVNVPHISGPDIRKYKFNLPGKDARLKIAEIIDAYDDLIENNLNRIKLLEEMAKITYEEWFVRMKFPGHGNAVFDEETGLPEGWKKSTLRDLTSYVNRGVAPKYVDENGVHVINQKCIRKHKVNYSGSRLTSLKQKIADDKIVLPLDILVNSTGTGTLGRVAQLFVPNGKTTVDTHVTIVRANENTCPFWLGRSLEALEPYIESLGKGATNQQELGRDDLADLVKLNAPPGELLKKFKEIAKPTYEVISNLLNQNESLKEARDILLPRLMTGMIDIEQVELPEAMLKRLEEQ